jgi:uncharacterized protein (TIGR02147 family)
MNKQIDIFQYDHYKNFLKDFIKTNTQKRGFKAYLALSAGCERSYFSQVLNSKAHFTPDHAFHLSNALEMTEQERDYWILLVEFGKTSTNTYRQFLLKKIKTQQIASQDMKNKFNNPPRLSEQAEILYFSKWYMVAIHLLCGVIQRDQINKIKIKLNLPQKIIQESINELVGLNLLIKKGSLWKPTKDVLYVHKSSPLCDIHHINWRQQAICDVQKKQEDSLHLTAVHSLSKDDFSKVRQTLLLGIQNSMELSKNSKEEVLACLNIDYFHYD